jgi:hypothetical protein
MPSAALLSLAIAGVSGCGSSGWRGRAAELRRGLRDVLVLPRDEVDPAGRTHQVIDAEGCTIESVTYAAAPGSRVTALLYLPEPVNGPVPAVVVACGHGGSKSAPYAQYAGQLYAKTGFICLVPDTIGEEERHVRRRMGTRAHDLYWLGHRTPEFVCQSLKRMVLGKIVLDLVRGIDYLETRPEVDRRRIGIVGYSLGGASAGFTSILDKRIRAAVLCGWVFRAHYGRYGKYCTRMPYAAFASMMGSDEMTALLAPRVATLFMTGAKDTIMDDEEGGAATVRDLAANLEGARAILDEAGLDGTIESEVEPEADHRPYFLTRRSVTWLRSHLARDEQRRAIPEQPIRFGEWVDGQGHRIERLYNTEARERGLEVVDVGAVWRDPKALACFPSGTQPGPEYTMQGWIAHCIDTNQGRPPLPDPLDEAE